MTSKIPVPGKRLSPNDVETYVDDINEALQAVDDSVIAFNQQVDAADTAETHANIAKEQADRASTIVLTPLLQIRKSKLDNPLCHLFKKNKLVDTLSGALSWTRASGATYIDRYGVLQYSPSPSATNLLAYSEDFSNSAWSAGGCTVTPNAAIAPNGELVGDKLVRVGAGESRSRYTTTQIGDTPFAFSVFAKAGSNGTLLRLRNLAAGGSNTAWFDLASGTVKTVQSGLTAQIYKEGSYYRCVVTGVTESTVANNIVDVAQSSEDNSSSGVDGEFIYVWGAQLEQSPVANGYIKTEATSKSGTSYFGIEQARQEDSGWLIEGGSTNYIRNSQDFSSLWEADGTGYRATIVSSDNVAPDGSLTATLVEDIDEVARYVRQVVTVSSGLTAACSIYVKQNTSDTCGFRMAWTGGSTVFQGVDFSFVTKTFSGSINNIELSYIELGNGWFRLIMTLTSPVDNTTIDFRAYPASVISGAPIGRSYMWGCQVEALPFASSYIPTTDSSVTRAADVVFCDTQYDSEVGDYSVTITYYNNAADIGVTRAIYYGDGTSYAQLSLASNNFVQFNAGTGAFPSTVQRQGVNNAVAVIEGQTAKLYNNGDYVQDTDIGERRKHNKMYLGSIRGSQALFGHIADFRIYDFALNPEEISFLGGE